jgi:hypothetical protein
MARCAGLDGVLRLCAGGVQSDGQLVSLPQHLRRDPEDKPGIGEARRHDYRSLNHRAGEDDRTFSGVKHGGGPRRLLVPPRRFTVYKPRHHYHYQNSGDSVSSDLVHVFCSFNIIDQLKLRPYYFNSLSSIKIIPWLF